MLTGGLAGAEGVGAGEVAGLDAAGVDEPGADASGGDDTPARSGADEQAAVAIVPAANNAHTRRTTTPSSILE